MDPDNNPTSGATVTCFSGSGTSGANGAFSIPGLPIAQGNIRCSASFVNTNGVAMSGSSIGESPVVGGNTNMGTIVLAPGSRLLVIPGDIQGGGLNQLDVAQTNPMSIQSTLTP